MFSRLAQDGRRRLAPRRAHEVVDRGLEVVGLVALAEPDAEVRAPALRVLAAEHEVATAVDDGADHGIDGRRLVARPHGAHGHGRVVPIVLLEHAALERAADADEVQAAREARFSEVPVLRAVARRRRLRRHFVAEDLRAAQQDELDWGVGFGVVRAGCEFAHVGQAFATSL